MSRYINIKQIKVNNAIVIEVESELLNENNIYNQSYDNTSETA